jgi:hypothetical protein
LKFESYENQKRLPEARTAVNGDVLVSLLETVVLAHVVQVVTANDDRARHLVLDDHAGQDATADGHVARERTLLVDVGALAGLNFKQPKFTPFMIY